MKARPLFHFLVEPGEPLPQQAPDGGPLYPGCLLEEAGTGKKCTWNGAQWWELNHPQDDAVASAIDALAREVAKIRTELKIALTNKR